MRGNRSAPIPPPSSQARRLDALWKAGTNPSLSDAQRIQTFLTLGALSLRAGHPFAARLERLEGEELVLEAGVEADAALSVVGSRVRITTGPHAELIRTGVICGWHDVRLSPVIARSPVVQAQGWQAIAGVSFHACGAAYTLMFVSPHALPSDFVGEDCDFIERLATTLAERLQTRWRVQRIEASAQARVPAEPLPT